MGESPWKRKAILLVALLAGGLVLLASGVVLRTFMIQDEALANINLPPGFSISVFAEAEDARSMTWGDEGTLFVGTRSAGQVYAIRDTNGDF